jgi:alcohol oxidase
VRHAFSICGDFIPKFCSGVDAGIKYRPTPAELEEIGPDFKKRWEEYFANKGDKPVIWMCQMSL